MQIERPYEKIDRKNDKKSNYLKWYLKKPLTERMNTYRIITLTLAQNFVNPPTAAVHIKATFFAVGVAKHAS